MKQWRYQFSRLYSLPHYVNVRVESALLDILLNFSRIMDAMGLYKIISNVYCFQKLNEIPSGDSHM